MKDKEKQIFDKYGNYDFPTEIKQDGLNTATSQIEEMAKDMADCNITCNECFEQLESVMTMKIKKRADHCQAYNYAERLYNAGYRKIPENAVMLTKEELKLIEKNAYRKGKTQQCWDIQNSTRKETAKEVFQKIETLYPYLDNEDEVFIGCLKEDLKELAKQFGVEIKE